MLFLEVARRMYVRMTTQLPVSPFDHFDPLTGRPGRHCQAKAERVLYRARTLLTGRNREQIQYLLDSVNYMLAYVDPATSALADLDNREYEDIDWGELNAQLTTPAPTSEPLSQQAGSPASIAQQHPQSWLLSPTEALEARRELFNIADQEDVPSAQWPEYFAALALGLVAEAQQPPGWQGPAADADALVTELRTRSYVAELLIDAMEAVTRAEMPSQPSRREAGAIDLRQKRAAIIRHGTSNRHKLAFIRYFNGEYLPGLLDPSAVNKTEAARRYYRENLQDQAPANAASAEQHKSRWLRTLKEALVNYEKRGILPNTPD